MSFTGSSAVVTGAAPGGLLAWRLARLSPAFVLRSGTRFVERQRAAAR